MIADGPIPSVRVHLLGALAVLVNGQPVTLPRSRKTRAIFAYLLLCARPVRRERLCELFFPVPDDPRAALRWSLSKIRQMLGDAAPLLVCARDHVALDAGPIETDIASLRAALDRRTMSAHAAADAMEAPLAGLDGVGGELYDAWLNAERADLDRVRRAALLMAAEQTLPPARSELFREAAAAIGAEAGESATLPRAAEQVVRYCLAQDGVRIAYACAGAGPPLVKAANWLNHLELDWSGPVWSYLFEALAAEHQLVRYDERGNGLSEREVADLSFDAFVRDLETVVDALRLDRFPLLGLSQGCAVSIAYAARHPERVSRLVLVGGYAAGWRVVAPPEEAEQREAQITLVRHGWGQDNPAYRQLFSLSFIPSGTAEELDWFNEVQRRSASPENAARFLRTFADIDVRSLLPEVRCPTLVLHARGDQRVPRARGRELAAGIPGAALVTLDSDSHIPVRREAGAEQLVTAVRAFLADSARPG